MANKIHNILIDFIDNLESSRTTLPIILKSLVEEFEKEKKDFDEFVDIHLKKYLDKKDFFSTLEWSKYNTMDLMDYEYHYFELSKDFDDEHEYIVPFEKINEFKKYEKKINHLSIALNTTSRNYLVSYVSMYDSFLGKLVGELLLLKPELFNNSDREIKFKDLVDFNSLDDAKDYILEKEINSLLRKSHVEQFIWMENKFGLPLTKGLEIWKDFIEITERRNLIVHNDGIVSNQYLRVCSEYKVNISDISVGEILNVSPKYLINANTIFYELGFKLVHVLWRKLFPEELESADNTLIEITYELLAQKRYKLVIKLLDFALNTIKRYKNDINERMIAINLAIAYKFSKHKDKCISIVNKYDWSASSPNFQLAVAVLEEEDSKVYELMKLLGKDNPYLDSISYAEWPLFEEYRKKEEFQNVYKEIYEKEIELIEIID